MNFVNLKETHLFLLVIKQKILLLYQWLVRDGKLREVSVSSFFIADNYAVAKEILVNKYCTKVKLGASIGETQSNHRQRIMPLPRRMDQNVSDAM